MPTTEERRREWAAQQNPELLTSRQALESFGTTYFPKFAKYLEDNGVARITVKDFPKSVFYNKSHIELLKIKYFEENPTKNRKVKPRSNYRTYIDKIVVSSYAKLPKTGWTVEQFMSVWGEQNGRNSIQDILERSQTIRSFEPEVAQKFLMALTRLGGGNYLIPGFRFDRSYFLDQLKIISTSDDEYRQLAKILTGLYNSTEIGKFDPVLVAKILRELFLSNTKGD